MDILVNNAGITRDAMLHKMTDEQWDQVIEVNLKGVFLCTQCAARVMREKGYGKIINISSTSWRGNPGQLQLLSYQGRSDRDDQDRGQGVGAQRD